MKETRSNRVFMTVNVIFLLLAMLIILLPLYYVTVISFVSPSEYLAKQGLVFFPVHWSISSYRYLLSASLLKDSMRNSIFITLVGTMISLITTSAFSYALSRKRLVGRKALQLIILITLLFDPGIIPNYIVVRDLHLVDNIWSMILPTLTNGWYIILMRSFFDTIPVELEESAAIDGCSDVRIFFNIILPISKAALAAFSLFFAVDYWNTFFKGLMYINTPSKWPLQVFLQNLIIESNTASAGSSSMMGDTHEIPAQTIKMAAVIISTIPILLAYPFLQKNFTKGVTLGSVKG